MRRTVTITDHGWYRTLQALPALEEVSFWRASSHRRFK